MEEKMRKKILMIGFLIILLIILTLSIDPAILSNVKVQIIFAYLMLTGVTFIYALLAFFPLMFTFPKNY